MQNDVLKQFMFVVLVLLFNEKLNAQDIRFSQWYNAPQLINPSYTAVFNGDRRAIVNYRNKGKDFNTTALSYDMSFVKKDAKTVFWGIGSFLYLDNNIPFSDKKIALSIARHKRINEKNIFSIGIQGAYDFKKVNTSSLRTSNTVLDINNKHSSYFDFSAGVLWNMSSLSKRFKMEIGFALQHINKPKVTLLGISEKENVQMLAHIRSTINIPNTVVFFIPDLLYVKNGSNYEIMPELYIKYQIRKKSKRKEELNLYVGEQYWVKKHYLMAIVLFEIEKYAIGLSYKPELYLPASNKQSRLFELSLKYIARD